MGQPRALINSMSSVAAMLTPMLDSNITRVLRDMQAVQPPPAFMEMLDSTRLATASLSGILPSVTATASLSGILPSVTATASLSGILGSVDRMAWMLAKSWDESPKRSVVSEAEFVAVIEASATKHSASAETVTPAERIDDAAQLARRAASRGFAGLTARQIFSVCLICGIFAAAGVIELELPTDVQATVNTGVEWFSIALAFVFYVLSKSSGD